MKRKPGPRSIASLAVVPLVVRPALKPPRGYTKAQAAVFRATVRTYPAEWWQGAADLLGSYCANVVDVDLLTVEIDAIERPVLREDFFRFVELTKLRDRLIGKIVVLARALRLSPNSRHRREAAGSQHGAAILKKPWEV
jgi:hypothetical protein